MFAHNRNPDAWLVQTVDNSKQIATLATIMANDRGSTGDPNLGWPGDLVRAAGKSKIITLGDYVDLMIEYDYIKRGEVPHVFGLGPTLRWDGTGQLTNKDCVFKIFKVTRSNCESTIFAESRNYTYNRPIDDEELRFLEPSFVVTRKDTSSASYKKRQYNFWQQIGTLTGHAAGEEKSATEDPSMILR